MKIYEELEEMTVYQGIHIPSALAKAWKENSGSNLDPIAAVHKEKVRARQNQRRKIAGWIFVYVGLIVWVVSLIMLKDSNQWKEALLVSAPVTVFGAFLFVKGTGMIILSDSETDPDLDEFIQELRNIKEFFALSGPLEAARGTDLDAMKKAANFSLQIEAGKIIRLQDLSRTHGDRVHMGSSEEERAKNGFREMYNRYAKFGLIDQKRGYSPFFRQAQQEIESQT